jgi:hypothetical protein
LSLMALTLFKAKTVVLLRSYKIAIVLKKIIKKQLRVNYSTALLTHPSKSTVSFVTVKRKVTMTLKMIAIAPLIARSISWYKRDSRLHSSLS